MSVGITGMLGKQGEADTGIVTLRAQNGKHNGQLFEGEEGSTTVVEHYRKLGTPTTDKELDAQFEKEINAWAEENVDASEREASGSAGLLREFTREDVIKFVAQLKNRNAAGAYEKVNELLKNGGEVTLTRTMIVMFNLIHKNEHAQKRWREVVNIFKKGDKADPGNYGGITLQSTVGRTFCNILHDRTRTVEEEENITEEQAGFGPNRSCVHHS